MMQTIRFTLVTDGEVLGDVVFDGTNLIADPALQDVVTAHLASGDGPADFVQAFDGWSNGYVSSSLVEPVKLRPVAEGDAALKDHLETTRFWDAEKGEMWEPKTPPPYVDPDPDPADSGEGEGRRWRTS